MFSSTIKKMNKLIFYIYTLYPDCIGKLFLLYRVSTVSFVSLLNVIQRVAMGFSQLAIHDTNDSTNIFMHIFLRNLIQKGK